MQPPQAETYAIRYSRGFDIDLYAAQQYYREKVQEEQIQLNDDQLRGLIIGFSMFGDIHQRLMIFNTQRRDITYDDLRFRGSVQFAGSVEGKPTQEGKELLDYLWSYTTNRPVGAYNLVVITTNEPLRGLIVTTTTAYTFDNLDFLQGILTACQWLNKDCRQNLKLYDRNGNRLEF